MGGICGFAGLDDRGLLERMTAAMARRGPDGEGFFERPGAALGCRRLDVLQGPDGAQPALLPDRDLALVLDGGIYNNRDLRRELEDSGVVLRSSSPVETLLRGYEAWGSRLPEKLNGDFAFALWDGERRRLLLVRDHFGVRPLYWWTDGRRLLFASELKALLAAPFVERNLDLQAVDNYLTLRYVPGEGTLIKGIRRLAPGSLLTVEDGRVDPRRYWTAVFDGEEYRRDQTADWAERLKELLDDAVRLRTSDEIVMGSHMSGGLDSSAVSSLMKRYRAERLRTYSIHLPGDAFEAPQAHLMAAYLGSDHTELLLEERAFEDLPEIVGRLDEPVGDPIVIAKHRLNRAAAGREKAILTGEGADELLGGYIHHYAVRYAYAYASSRLLPSFLKNTGVGLLGLTPMSVIEELFPYPDYFGRNGREKLARLVQGVQDLPAAYVELLGLVSPEVKDRLYAPGFRAQTDDGSAAAILGAALPAGPSVRKSSALDRVMTMDLANWLPNYTLRKADALSMTHGLEARAPFLDHRLAELAVRIPVKLRIQAGTVKYVFRRAASDFLPGATAWAVRKPFALLPEQVFGPAYEEFAREILTEETLGRRGLFDPAETTALIGEGRENPMASKRLAAILILELWMREVLDRR